MNKKAVENLIKSKTSDFVPRIDNRIAEIKQTEIKREKPRPKNNFWRKFVAVAATLIIAVTCVIAAYGELSDYTVYLDINPSIKLVIAYDDTVKQAIMLNSDAESLISPNELSGKNVDDVFDIIVAKLNENEFFAENGEIVLSSTDSEKNSKLQKYYDKLEKALEKQQIKCQVSKNKVTKQEQTQIEDAKKVSAGQLKYMNEILALCPQADYDALAQKSISELKLIEECMEQSGKNQAAQKDFLDELLSKTKGELQDLAKKGNNGKK